MRQRLVQSEDAAGQRPDLFFVERWSWQRDQAGHVVFVLVEAGKS
jgi:hypothetical protein